MTDPRDLPDHGPHASRSGTAGQSWISDEQLAAELAELLDEAAGRDTAAGQSVEFRLRRFLAATSPWLALACASALLRTAFRKRNRS